MKLFERMLSRPTAMVEKETKEKDGLKVKKKAAVKHLLVRYNDHLKSKNFPGTIVAHLEIAQKLGYVWFGKIGKTIRKDYITYVKNEKRPVFVYFLKTKAKNCELYQARILDITTNDVRLTPEKKHVPEYYQETISEVGFWIKIGDLEKKSTEIMTNIIVSSSRSPLLESLVSVAGVMFVETESNK